MVVDTHRKVTLKVGTRVTRASLNSAASGSIYGGGSGGEESGSEEEEEEGYLKEEEDDEDDEAGYGQRKTRSRSAARQRQKGKAKAKKRPSVEYEEYQAPIREELNVTRTLSSGRRTTQKYDYIESSDNDDLQPASRQPRISKRAGVVESDEEGGAAVRKSSRIQNKQHRTQSVSSHNSRATAPKAEVQKNERAQRLQKRSQQRDPSYEEEADVDADGEANPDMVLDPDATPTSPDPDPEPMLQSRRANGGSKNREVQGYRFRKRAPVNYVIPPPLDETIEPLLAKNSRSRAKGKNRMNWNLNGMDLSRAMGMGLPQDDTDSDAPGKSPKKRVGAANGPAAAGGLYTSGPLPQDLGGGPANLGKITSSSNALADTDPLGVNPNINFDAVGGLDTHIASLKEMTLLPLLYPEVFQRFGVTPPRGVLFHGPPGTGKTLMARALASSCRSDGRSISFFMRKGADCLSKWVGEAERQLRLLFEEARNSQPSIIFFDEIDGLAPVRSSKQDQIHASIVSTLLALMDGMDGRGQVIVIGATNRPDAIDSALRRPGRFDREFYFPLPSLPDRQSILRIHTHQWEGWEKDSERGEVMRKKLAEMTKGYGGADLRMLCTEAALNAVQRTFPQIYKSTDRLLVQPEKIKVQPRDFMGAIKKLVPSSARSTATTAAPIPTQLTPLLTPALEHVKSLVTKILPTNPGKKRDLLEEAEWEWDDDGDENKALEREMLMQSMETLRVYRPRLVLCGGNGKRGGEGGAGNGVGYVAAAVLDWLEGFHVQSLDLATLMSDSTRTVEAAIVQLFVEAKRRQPSVIYIPSLTGWCATVSETSRSTVKAMLDTLAPTDPVLLLAIVDGPFTSLPPDVRKWFGFARETNQVDFSFFAPTPSQRAQFFEDIVGNVQKRPSDFPGGWKRRRRVLEVLPIAPPVAPKPPSETELAVQLENDMRTLTVLKYRLGPVLNDLKRKFKIFTRRACEDYGFNPDTGIIEIPQAPEPVLMGIIHEDNEVQIVPDDAPVEYVEPPVQPPPVEEPIQIEPPSPAAPKVKFHNMDLEAMQHHLYCDKYLSLEDFMADIAKIARNAQLAGMLGRADQERAFKAQALLTAAQVHYLDFDPTYRAECGKMAARERQRREEARKAAEKEKEKEKEKEGEYPPGTRRSNRANGLAPEHGISDIGKIERSLKRMRSSEPGSAREDGSGEDGRSNKRSKISGGQDGGQPGDETNLQDGVGPGEPEILAAATPTPPPQTQPLASTSDLQIGSDGSLDQPTAPPVSSIFSLLNGDSPPNHVGANVFQEVNPFLPNPNPNEVAGGSAGLHTLQPPPIVHGQLFANSVEMNVNAQHPDVLPPQPNDSDVGAPNALPIAADADEPMSVEEPNIITTPPRTPTPPPEFILDEMQLSTLENALAHDTDPLDVEQLEQLRASALDTIWRARSTWDRNPLIADLLTLIKEFVGDVKAAIREAERHEEDSMFPRY